ncbi:alanine/glycine:cation symporter family protein [Kytococcus sedentarius]|uniref:alanine/glycine:cation symporter family protein n=1 Tax=Kytococcus sedentarius TaxID=1276 RepID=UPI0035BBA280
MNSLSPVPVRADWKTSLEESINETFDPIQEWFAGIIFYPVTFGDIEVPFVVIWLVAAGIIVTGYFAFIQFRGLPTALDVVRGKYSTKSDPGEITHFQALSSALSGTVGLGNIAGVGAAVALGGPGATFWMIVCGLLGMATKFAECTLGVKYREVRADGTVDGGPFKYLPVAYGKIHPIVGTLMTGLFAISILFFGAAGGNMFQSNQTYAQMKSVTGGDDGFLGGAGASLLFGIGLAVIVGLVIMGGIKSIGKVTEKLVPAMGLMYLAACLIVIAVNITHVPDAIGRIVTDAFNPEGVVGGVIGTLIVGFQRAAFSNEAGLGSAPIAHSAVKTRRPVSEGFVALLEPLADTVIICTFTALTIIIADTEIYNQSIANANDGDDATEVLDGVLVTSDAFETVLPWFPYVLAVAVFLFAISTQITWAYYAMRAWAYLFGDSRASMIAIKCIYLFFTVLGAVLTLTAVMNFADSWLFLCAFINLLGVYLLLPVIKREMKEYLADRKAGRLDVLGDENRDSFEETDGATSMSARS